MKSLQLTILHTITFSVISSRCIRVISELPHLDEIWRFWISKIDIECKDQYKDSMRACATKYARRIISTKLKSSEQEGELTSKWLCKLRLQSAYLKRRRRERCLPYSEHFRTYLSADLSHTANIFCVSTLLVWIHYEPISYACSNLNIIIHNRTSRKMRRTGTSGDLFLIRLRNTVKDSIKVDQEGIYEWRIDPEFSFRPKFETLYRQRGF